MLNRWDRSRANANDDETSTTKTRPPLLPSLSSSSSCHLSPGSLPTLLDEDDDDDDTASPSAAFIIVPPPPSLPHIVSSWLDDDYVTSPLFPPPLTAMTMRPSLLKHLSSLPPLPTLHHNVSHAVRQPWEQPSPHPPVDPDMHAGPRGARRRRCPTPRLLFLPSRLRTKAKAKAREEQ